MIWPAPVTIVSPIFTEAIPSGATTVIAPLVVSTGVASAVPGAPSVRAGKPASSTTVPAPEVGSDTTLAGLSPMEMVRVAVSLSPSPSVRV